MANVNDKTPEEVGHILCQAHEYIQKHGATWEKDLDNIATAVSTWLLHPLGRNWNLISGIEDIIDRG